MDTWPLYEIATTSGNSNKWQPMESKRSVLRGTILILLLNICLLAFVFTFYAYYNNLADVQRLRVINILGPLGGVLLIALLLSAGDMSKNKPNFYHV